METKNQKFRRMLELRLPKAVKAIELLANLSRKTDYEWTAPQLQSMLDQLDDAVDGVAQAFGAPTSSTKPATMAGVPAGAAQIEERLTGFQLVAEARRVGDEELAKATLDAIIDRWLKED